LPCVVTCFYDKKWVSLPLLSQAPVGGLYFSAVDLYSGIFWRMKKLTLFLALLISAPSFALAFDGRYIRFEHLIPEINGKPIFGISSILQDREGFMWFGTGLGLTRYDGYEFTFFSPFPEQEPSSSLILVYPIFEGRQGDIWIGTNGEGLFRFVKKRERFIQYKHDPSIPHSLSGNIVLSIQEDRNGDLWIGTRYGGLCRFDRETETFYRVNLRPDVETIWDIYADREGFIWVGTHKRGLFKLDSATEEIVNYMNDPHDPDSLGDNGVWCIFEDSEGTIWVGTNRGGLNRYLPEKEGFMRYSGDRQKPDSLDRSRITALAEDASGKIWIGTGGNGLRIFDKTSGEFIAYKHDPQDPDSLGSDLVTSIYRDNSGIMWAGGGGINKALNDQVKFLHFKHNPHNPLSIGHDDVRCLLLDSSEILWVGTKEGLYGIDEKGNSIARFTHDTSDTYSLSDNCVQAILEDKYGMIWLGTAGGGLERFDPRTRRFTHHRNTPGDSNSLSHNQVHAIHSDRQDADILWIGTNYGLNRLNMKASRFTRFLSDLSDSTSLSSNRVSAIGEDSSGNLWIGTQSGLNMMDKKTGKCVQYIYDIRSFQGDGINNNFINSVHEDKSGNLWIGTDDGINKFEKTKGEWKYYTIKEGLPGSIAYGILEDERGHLWVSTNLGLARFDPETEIFTNYGIHDGLQGNKFNPGSYLKSPDGRMFFGGVNGYNSFHPQNIKNNTFIPPVVWTAFYKHDQQIKFDQALSSLRDLDLSYKFDFITFRFAALCFAHPVMNQFAYRLEGRDDDWIYLGPNNTVSFTKLGAGEYVLHVRGANPDGIWNEEGISIHIQIIPPFWKATWFAIIVAILASAFVISWFRARKKYKAVHLAYEQSLEDVFAKYSLTQREQEIVRLILEGASNKDIEKKLFISSSTVRNHIYNIYQKLGVQNRLELINLVKRHAQK